MARFALAAASIALLSLSALTAAHAQVGATIVIQSGSPHYQRPAPALVQYQAPPPPRRNRVLVVGAARLDDDGGANLCMRRRQGAQRQQGDGSGGEGYACHGVLLRKDSVRNREP